MRDGETFDYLRDTRSKPRPDPPIGYMVLKDPNGFSAGCYVGQSDDDRWQVITYFGPRALTNTKYKTRAEAEKDVEQLFQTITRDIRSRDLSPYPFERLF